MPALLLVLMQNGVSESALELVASDVVTACSR